MHLLARHAESMFWLGRYIERAASLSRILLVQTAFDRGRAEGAGWAWILALYDESESFHKRYDEPSARNVIRFYLNDPEHPGSILRSLEAARSNARTLRAMISTDLWTHMNRAYGRVKGLSAAATGETRLAGTCEAIQIDCYALLGIAGCTLYRDAGWRFFEMGIEVEQADQMSRLLDVRFAQMQTGIDPGLIGIGDFAHWSMLLRACGGQHAYRQLVSGPLQPENVARFLIFEQSFARSIAHCAAEIERAAEELRSVCHVATPTHVLERISGLHDALQLAQHDPGLIPHLHAFNDGVQRHLASITHELARCYFDVEVSARNAAAEVQAMPDEPEWVKPSNEGGEPEPGDGKDGEGAARQEQVQSQSDVKTRQASADVTRKKSGKSRGK